MKRNSRSAFFLLVLGGCLGCVHSTQIVGTLPLDISCLAVLPFEVRNDATNLPEVLSEFIALEFQQRGTLGVVGPHDVVRMFKESNDPLPPVIDPYWAKSIGRKLGVDAVIFGSIGQLPIVRQETNDHQNILLSIEAFLMDTQEGVIHWSYGIHEEVKSDYFTTRLSQHAEIMTNSLDRRASGKWFGTGAQCWEPPPKIRMSEPMVEPSPKQVVSAVPTTKAVAPLTKIQKRLLEDLLKHDAIILPAFVFQGRSGKVSKLGIEKLKELSVVLLSEESPKEITIAGNVDATSNGPDDLEISKRRAEAVKNELIRLGVDAKRMRAIGYGGTQPLVPNLNQKSRLLNQRVEILAIDAPKP